MSRPTKNEYFLRMARLASSRGTCIRRQVGCVLINERGHVLATGYNGVASGQPHCNEWSVSGPNGRRYVHACEGAQLPSGQGLDKCEAIHAEQNALLQCKNVWEIDSCYVTHSPCITCVKLLMGTSCKRIIFSNKYAHDADSMKLWNSVTGRVWEHFVGD